MAASLSASQSKLLAYTVAIVAVGAFLGNLFILKPQKAELIQVKSRSAEFRDKSDTIGRISEIEKALLAFRPALSQDRESAWLVERLNEVALDCGLTLSSLTPAARESVEDYLRLPVRVEFQCDFHQLGEFVSRLERDDHYLQIDRLSVASAAQRPSDSASGSIRVTMQLCALFPLKDPA